MAKIINFCELVADDIAADDELVRMIRERTRGNFWETKKKRVLELIEQKYIPQKVKEVQRKAVDELFVLAKSAIKSKVPARLVHRIVDKKAWFLVDAKSVKEIKEIMQLSVSHFEGNGFVVTGKYHIPEEEMLLLGIASRMGKLTEEAQERFVFLYEQCYQKGEVEEDE